MALTVEQNRVYAYLVGRGEWVAAREVYAKCNMTQSMGYRVVHALIGKGLVEKMSGTRMIFCKDGTRRRENVYYAPTPQDIVKRRLGC